MNKESIWKLLARKMAGEATWMELNELHELLRNDPAMNYIAETFSRLWNALPVPETEERIVRRIAERIKENDELRKKNDGQEDEDTNFFKTILC